MKQVLFTCIGMLAALTMAAQLPQGTVTYTRSIRMEFNSGMQDQLAQLLPRSRTDQFELMFGNNQSIWKHVDDESSSDEISGNGMQIRMMAQGQNDIVFHDFGNAKKTEQREMMERKFLVTDSIRRLNWTLSSETKVLLGHVCSKATAIRTGSRMQMTMANGKMERKEVSDTSAIVAWFTTDIPVPAGPELQGQLPGLILALDISNGRITYTALDLSPKADLAGIKEPSKGKKLTPEEYTKEIAKMMDDMQRNNRGSGNRIMRVN